MNIRKILFIFVVIASFTVISANVVSYVHFNVNAIEFAGDYAESMEFDETDWSEDGDSLHSTQKFSPQVLLSSGYTNPHLLYNHFVAGINTPPPELA